MPLGKIGGLCKSGEKHRGAFSRLGKRGCWALVFMLRRANTIAVLVLCYAMLCWAGLGWAGLGNSPAVLLTRFTQPPDFTLWH